MYFERIPLDEHAVSLTLTLALPLTLRQLFRRRRLRGSQHYRRGIHGLHLLWERRLHLRLRRRECDHLGRYGGFQLRRRKESWRGESGEHTPLFTEICCCSQRCMVLWCCRCCCWDWARGRAWINKSTKLMNVFIHALGCSFCRVVRPPVPRCSSVFVCRAWRAPKQFQRLDCFYAYQSV